MSGTVAGTSGDHPVKVCPSCVTSGGVSEVPYSSSSALPPIPPFASNVIVYLFGVHCAV